MDDSDRADEHWPDADGPDPDWPDDWPAATGHDEAHGPPASHVPGRAGRGRRTLALALTATIALGAGAGAVYLYRGVQGGSAEPGASASAAPSGPADGAATSVTMLGRVLAVGRDTLTVGGGPFPSISAVVTGATRFTGADRSLAQVRVGDLVTVQITQSDGVARVYSLQDPG